MQNLAQKRGLQSMCLLKAGQGTCPPESDAEAFLLKAASAEFVQQKMGYFV